METVLEFNKRLADAAERKKTSLFYVGNPIISASELEEMEKSPELHVRNALSFTRQKLPDREPLMIETPGNVLLYRQSLNQILAWRGVGKTVFALSLSGALCSGGQILGFQAVRPAKVMYIDGELPLKQLQERVAEFVPEGAQHNLYLINAEMNKAKQQSIDLAGNRSWNSLLKHLDHFQPEVLVLDSRSTLFPSLENNKEAAQGVIQARMLQLRLRGLCVIELHHEGKGGLQRGHSKNDDVLDVQLHFKKPNDWDPADGMRFEMAFDKVRHAARFESGYEVVIQDGKFVRKQSDRDADITRLAMEGKSQRQIAKELGISQPTVGKILKKAKASGVEFPQKEAK